MPLLTLPNRTPLLPRPAPGTAVLLCNLGTPDAPTAPALRRYLAEFLGDPRVVEIPRWLWMLILHGIILRTRPAKSAAKYASVWTPEGSPLAVWTPNRPRCCRPLGARPRVLVRHAMRYGNPSWPAAGCPQGRRRHPRADAAAYPQYSGTTTASVLDAVYSLGGPHAPRARAALCQPLPRRRRLHRRAGRHGAQAHWQATASPTSW
jgi:ferrochelatase